MPCLGARKKQQPSIKNSSSISNSLHLVNSSIRQQSTPPIVNGKFNPPNFAEPTLSSGINGHSRSGSISSHQSMAVAQIRQEYNELKSKNMENLELIAKQTAELEHLKKLLSMKSQHVSPPSSLKEEDEEEAVEELAVQKKKRPSSIKSTKSSHNSKRDTQFILLDLEARNQETLSTLAKKEALLEESKQQIQDLLKRVVVTSEEEKGQQQQEEHNEMYLQQLEEKDKLLLDKQKQLEELKLQWETERAELIKPALQQVNLQLEELKETNKIAVERLTEKENELAELRSQLNRRERKPKESLTKDQENRKRLNRLTIDLENDRLLIQRLEELNQQLETQKQKHESILESHAQVIAEKDKTLLQQQKSLKQLKISHENATKTLEQEQLHNLNKLQHKHETDIELINKRLKHAENQAKSNVDDELDKILVEFEQSQHNHSMQVAHLQQSYQEQISVMRQGQQAELQSLIGGGNSKSAGSGRLSQKPSVSKLRDSKFQWPPIASPTIAL